MKIFNVHVDDWIAELSIIASNAVDPVQAYHAT